MIIVSIINSDSNITVNNNDDNDNDGPGAQGEEGPEAKFASREQVGMRRACRSTVSSKFPVILGLCSPLCFNLN